jgi:hypothetical protein
MDGSYENLPTIGERLLFLLFLLNSRSKDALEKTFPDELVDQTIVDGLAEIEIL